MTEASFESAAAFACRCGLQPEFQSSGMNGITERLHVGKLLIAMKHAISVARTLPAIVDFDIDVTQSAQAGDVQALGRLAYRLIVHHRTELFAAGPSHRRRLCEIVW